MDVTPMKIWKLGNDKVNHLRFSLRTVMFKETVVIAGHEPGSRLSAVVYNSE